MKGQTFFRYIGIGFARHHNSNAEKDLTPLPQRFIADMQRRGLAPSTQRSYLHYVAEFAKFYDTSPEHLDLEAVRQYELHLLHEKKHSPQSIHAFISTVQFLYLVTLEMPWSKACFPRLRCPETSRSAQPPASRAVLRTRSQSEPRNA